MPVVTYSPTPKAILEKNKAQLELIIQSTAKPKKPKLEYVPKPPKKSALDSKVIYIPSTIVNESSKVDESEHIAPVSESNGPNQIWPSFSPEQLIDDTTVDTKTEESEPTFSPPDSENHSEVDEVPVPETKNSDLNIENKIKEKSIKKDKSKFKTSKSSSSSSRHRHKSSSHSRSHTSSASSKHKSSSSDKHRRSSSSSHKSSRRDSSSSKDVDRRKSATTSESKSKSSSNKSLSSRSDKRESSKKSHGSSSSKSSSSNSKKELSKKENKQKESHKKEAIETIEKPYDLSLLSPSSIFDTDSSDEDEIMKQCRMIFEEFQNKPPENNHNDKEKNKTYAEDASKLQEVNIFDESINKKKRVAHESNNLPVRKLPTVVPKPNHVQNAMQSIYLRQQSMMRKAEEEQKEREKQEAAAANAAAAASAATPTASTFNSPSIEIFKPHCN